VPNDEFVLKFVKPGVDLIVLQARLYLRGDFSHETF